MIASSWSFPKMLPTFLIGQWLSLLEIDFTKNLPCNPSYSLLDTRFLPAPCFLLWFPSASSWHVAAAQWRAQDSSWAGNNVYLRLSIRECSRLTFAQNTVSSARLWEANYLATHNCDKMCGRTKCLLAIWSLPEPENCPCRWEDLSLKSTDHEDWFQQDTK